MFFFVYKNMFFSIPRNFQCFKRFIQLFLSQIQFKLVYFAFVTYSQYIFDSLIMLS